MLRRVSPLGRLAGVLLLPVLLGALLLAQPSVAKASENAASRLSLSSDGVNFTPNFNGPVLIGIDRYVPGDENQRTVWLRNDSNDPAWLWSTYRTTSMDAALAPYLSIAASYGAAGTPAGEAFAPVDKCTSLLPAQKVSAGQTVQAVIAARFAAEAPNETRLTTAEFAVNFGLTQDIGQPNGPDGCSEVGGDNGSGGDGTGGSGSGSDGTITGGGQNTKDPLPETGAAGLIPWLSLAAAAALTGFIALFASRRKEKEVR